MFDDREHFEHPLRMGNQRKRAIPIYIHVGEENPIDRNFLEIEEHDSILLNFTFPDGWKYHTKRLCSVTNGRDIWTGWLDSNNRYLIPMPIVHRDGLVIRIIGYANQHPLPAAHIILRDGHLIATTDEPGNDPEYDAGHFEACVPYTGKTRKKLMYRCGRFVTTTEHLGEWIDIQTIQPRSETFPSGYMLWEMNDYPIKIEREEGVCRRTTESSRDSKNSSLLRRYEGRQMKPNESQKTRREVRSMDPIQPISPSKTRPDLLGK